MNNKSTKAYLARIIEWKLVLHKTLKRQTVRAIFVMFSELKETKISKFILSYHALLVVLPSFPPTRVIILVLLSHSQQNTH